MQQPLLSGAERLLSSRTHGVPQRRLRMPGELLL